MERVDRSSSAAGWPTRSSSPRATRVGKSLLERDRIEDAQRILETGRGEGRRVPAADRRRGRQGGHPRRRAQDRAGPQDPQLVVRGRHRARQRSRRSRRRSSRRRPSFWNGPLGVFEVPDVRRRHARHGALPGALAPEPASRSWWAAATRSPRSRSSARRQVHPHLHRRRRQPRVPGGQGAARHRRAPGPVRAVRAGSRKAAASPQRQPKKAPQGREPRSPATARSGTPRASAKAAA